MGTPLSSIFHYHSSLQVCRGAAFKSSRVGEREGFDDGSGKKGQAAEIRRRVFRRRELVAAAKSAGLSPK
jgi:hypothetical protein